MNVMRGSLLAASTLLFLACGREQTMASKSAAAYREAQAKGTPVTGGHEHGGHEVTSPDAATGAMDHAAHGTAADPHAGHDRTGAGTDHGAHDAMSVADHAAMGHGTARGASGDHTAHAATASAAHDQHAGMQHATAAPSSDPHAQHRQATSANAHAGHGVMQQPAPGAPRVVSSEPASSAAMARMQPAATLHPDDFDTPAAIAVEEARKAAEGGGGHEDYDAPGTRSPTTGTDPHAGHGGAGGASQQTTVYTCPMHPEVTSATPGNCPKCGMALVKATATKEK